MVTHRLMAGLLAKALQCNQTRVFNVLFSDTTSNLRRAGSTTTHHTLTHEEPVDAALGFQKEVGWFATRSMVAWREFLDELAGIPEGDGTLLDHTTLLYGSGMSNSQLHLPLSLPTLIVGGKTAGITAGRHVRYPEGTPFANLHLGLLHRLGAKADSIGDSTGPLSGL